ncbi:hypothetical protein L798_10184 [Zootermopsis nevadensis]|uniref:Uncharacterized protein n=1 Tax=Zootermopsis nevadensis TaxID=136037 RepID=A0A067R1L0_ZOONE|nr:hypothetical protein L798_10184 [Zootermopsis nevadensis]
MIVDRLHDCDGRRLVELTQCHGPVAMMKLKSSVSTYMVNSYNVSVSTVVVVRKLRIPLQSDDTCGRCSGSVRVPQTVSCCCAQFPDFISHISARSSSGGGFCSAFAWLCVRAVSVAVFYGDHRHQTALRCYRSLKLSR